MGYYSYYRLDLIFPPGFDGDENEYMYKVIGDFRKICPDAEHCLSEEGFSECDGKWYEHLKDITAFSKKYPELMFCLYGEGEDGSKWVVYAKNGKSQDCQGSTVYEKINPKLFDDDIEKFISDKDKIIDPP